ncbi:hypothetical protein [Propionivibrio sp.]|uniref:hypothetical protein n=1 Tax=Propionivibrio sp. TaxID=2212460 RepID=UPI003BF050CD
MAAGFDTIFSGGFLKKEKTMGDEVKLNQSGQLLLLTHRSGHCNFKPDFFLIFRPTEAFRLNSRALNTAHQQKKYEQYD